MARKKVTLAYIASDATRRATLKKRCSGLMKKAKELSILCGVPVCVVVYAPDQADQAEVFPPPEEAKEILMQLYRMPDLDKKKKKIVDQRSFLEQRLLKLSQQLRRLEHENGELAAAVLFRECLSGRPADSLGKEESDALLDLLDRKARAVRVRMHQLLGAAYDQSPPLQLAMPLPIMASPISAVENVEEKISFEAAAIEAMRRCNWIGGCVADVPLLAGDEEVLRYAGHGTVVGCSGDVGGGAPDDLLAMLVEQMNDK